MKIMLLLCNYICINLYVVKCQFVKYYYFKKELFFIYLFVQYSFRDQMKTIEINLLLYLILYYYTSIIYSTNNNCIACYCNYIIKINFEEKTNKKKRLCKNILYVQFVAIYKMKTNKLSVFFFNIIIL